MASFNQVILVGNLTRDPELRVTPKGTAICQFGLAVNRQFKDDSGQTRDETTFVDIEAWGKQGELIAKYLTKGSPALVQGRLKLDQWEDKQSGQKRSKLKVEAGNGAGGEGPVWHPKLGVLSSGNGHIMRLSLDGKSTTSPNRLTTTLVYHR